MLRLVTAQPFPPFDTFRMVFPAVTKPADLAEVHLLTGVNGTGKTRILSLLTALFQHAEPLQNRLAGQKLKITASLQQPPTPPERLTESIYEATPQGLAQKGGNTDFQAWAEKVPAFAYSGRAYVTDAAIAPMAEVPRPTRAACLAFNRLEDNSKVLLQAIANLKLQAAMDWMNANTPSAAPPSRAARIVGALENTITEITGKPFLFRVTSYPKPVLNIDWGSATLPLSLLPDGLRAIIGTLAHAMMMLDSWLQGKGDPTDTPVVFLLDEIEAHLHPAWQRRILPAFQRLFPRAQIFIATHSPFVIASLNHGWIHSLTLDRSGVAKVPDPIPASEGDSYVSVLEDIMGVPELYDLETEQLIADFRKARDAAYTGDSAAKDSAMSLAARISSRSMELHYLMGRELHQMDRHIANHRANPSNKAK